MCGGTWRWTTPARIRPPAASRVGVDDHIGHRPRLRRPRPPPVGVRSSGRRLWYVGSGAPGAVAPRDRLASLLGAMVSPGSSSAHATAGAEVLHLEVSGVGRVQLPVPKEQARQLIKVARPARYGMGEQTLRDPSVRDTWEVPKSRVRIDQRRWNNTLVPVLERLRGDLGLPAGRLLKAELHSMLVYARGQFFVPHQDSEKADRMVGSLVVTLPSSCTGGALVVGQGPTRREFRSPRSRLSFVAFYGDCQHEVRPVRSGHRIVLTYNLLLHDDPPTALPVPAHSTEGAGQLAAFLTSHFAAPAEKTSWQRTEAPAEPPQRLVYLLDHQYTEHSLGRPLLKGVDGPRVEALRDAAHAAECEIALALAEVHQTWSAYEADDHWDGRRGHGRWNSWDDDDDDNGEDDTSGEADYELEELIDSEVTLAHWTDLAGGPMHPISSSVDDAELCATTPADDLDPDRSDYEPYMGNYGNTLDRWYRRAAVVMWPRERGFVVRAEASPSWALGEVANRLKAKDLEEARDLVGQLAPFWTRVMGRHDPPPLSTKALRVAAGIDDPALAAMLLSPFHLEVLGKSHAAHLSAMADRYGEPWLTATIHGWSREERAWSPGGRDRGQWVTALPGLVRALAAQRTGGNVAAVSLVESAAAWLVDAIDRCGRISTPSRRQEALDQLARPALSVLESAAAVGAAGIRDRVFNALLDDPRGDALLGCLIQLLRASKADPQTAAAIGLDVIREHCTKHLHARLARPGRGKDDWAITWPDGCGCAVCATLGTFLTDPNRRTLDWPLAKDGRRHVHNRIDSSELPVRHQTRRTGRPFTLVLTKTDALFKRDEQQRRRDKTDLRWLSAPVPAKQD